VTLAILVEFFVIALFHETKIPMVDMEVQVYSNFSKKIQKKWNLQAPWRMEDFKFPKNGGVVHPFFQNARPISKLPHNSKIK
jgi:hypothetical protein